jgi:glucose-6-phosphate dehydrogenase assembly protein OpcA
MKDNLALGQPVAVGDIDRELRKLWEADEAATNASLMNFAVYSESADDLENNSEAIQGLAREHACRAILIGMERECEEMSVQAWITAHCHLLDGNKSVCCEQLSFLLRGKAVGRLRNTVFAHLNSDLPLVFWWQGELSDLFEERLYSLMDRLIVDSSEWQDVPAGFRKLASAVENSRCQMAIQDIAWTRTYHFRLGIAGLFDDSSAQEMLETLSTVSVEARPENWTSAWMMIAWLGTQLEWTYLGTDNEDRGKTFRFARAEGGEIEVRLVENPEGAPLSKVTLANENTSVSVTRERDKSNLTLSLEAPHHEVNQMTPADPDGRVELVTEQLSRGGKNSLFRKVWPLFFEMLEMDPSGVCAEEAV